jgi:hypothetical protein
MGWERPERKEFERDRISGVEYNPSGEEGDIWSEIWKCFEEDDEPDPSKESRD